MGRDVQRFLLRYLYHVGSLNLSEQKKDELGRDSEEMLRKTVLLNCHYIHLVGVSCGELIGRNYAVCGLGHATCQCELFDILLYRAIGHSQGGPRAAYGY